MDDSSPPVGQSEPPTYESHHHVSHYPQYQAADAPPPGICPQQSHPHVHHPAYAQPTAYEYPPQGFVQGFANCEQTPACDSYPPASYSTTATAYAAGPSAYPAGAVVPGYPTSAHHVAMAHNSVYVYSQTGNEPCECSAGWVLFGVGWIFPICWLIGACLPCCSKNRNDRRAAIGSGIMFGVTVVVAILAVVIPLTILAGAAASAAQSSNQYSSYSHTTYGNT